MHYYNIKNKSYSVSFKTAVIDSIAADKGLFFPTEISPLSTVFLKNISQHTPQEIAFETIKQFIGDEIPSAALKQIIQDTLNFDIPLIKLDTQLYCLELFHGPSLAFKDVGARFMSRCLQHLLGQDERITVLVATSGDTGGAVASGFYNVPNIDVVILYPEGNVSPIQEMQLTTHGDNIQAIAIQGSFDDCQDIVKKAFTDHEITRQRKLSSANSINIARWLPQMWYYFFAYQQIKHKENDTIFAVPSGNFGNICAGMIAKKLGLPIQKLIACNNDNNVVYRFLQSEQYVVEKTIPTISNAMDVGNPSNFSRILELHDWNISALRETMDVHFFNDEETKKGMATLFKKHNYIADPHTAIGYLGLQNAIKKAGNTNGVFLGTAHPVKFLETVEKAIKQPLKIPKVIATLMQQNKNKLIMDSYNEVKAWLLS